MRLRRETGDFQIRANTVNGTVTYNSIRPGLTPEDFIGETVYDSYMNNYYVITRAYADDPNTVYLVVGENEAVYDSLTGEITEADRS